LGKVYQRAVLRCPGIIFPTPYPQGYGATPPLPRPPQSACDVPRSMPEAAADGNAGCVVHRGRPAGDGTRLPAAADTRRRPSGTTESPPHRVAIASRHRTAPGSDAAPAPAPATDRPRPSPPPTGPRPAWSAARCSAACPNRPSSWRTAHPPAMHAPPPPASRVDTAACRTLLRRSERLATHRTEGAHRSSRAKGSHAGRTTESGTGNRIFSANFSPLSIPWRIGRSTPLLPGKKRPRGTLPPDRDGPLTGGALPCTARGWNAS
jgi:hypothetical protein